MSAPALAAAATWLVMGTVAQIQGSPCLTSEQAFREIQEVETRYSTWKDDSELSKLNRERKLAIGSRLGPELTTVLELSQKWSGAFHPGLGRWILASGVRQGKAPSLPALHALGIPPAALGVSLKQALGDPRFVFEEGGFAKGLALDQARNKIRPTRGSRCRLEINLGGQTLVWGRSARVRIASPSDRNEPWVELTLKDASVATSGQSEQPGHLLDPRTGLPSPNRGSATVIHPSALEADIASTALAILGPKSLHIPPQLDWIYLEPEGHATAPARLRAKYQIRSLRPLRWTWVD